MLGSAPKTIREHIDCLARLTGAPDAFVLQVKELFSTKGISLEEDASPYLRALEEAFRREETIRTSARRARENLSRVRSSFDRVGRSSVGRVSSAERSMLRAGGASPGRTEVPIPGDHRTYVTPTASEELPMVPGPDDLQ